MDERVRYEKDDDWRSTHIKRRKVQLAIKDVLDGFKSIIQLVEEESKTQ